MSKQTGPDQAGCLLAVIVIIVVILITKFLLE
jgi:hypothetical protein